MVWIRPKIPGKLNSSSLEVFRLDRFGLDGFGLITCERDGICVDPPLCLGTSEGKYGSCTEGLVCVGEIVGKIGEVGERELVFVVSVRCGKERDMTRRWQLFWDTKMCNPEPSSLSHACSRDEMWSISSACVVTHSAHLHMLFEWVFCSHRKK